MSYRSLEECLLDLEKHGQLVRVKEEVDPYLEMAAIQLRLYEQQGPAVLFENVKGSNFRAVCNLFGTLERGKFIFRKTMEDIQTLISVRKDPAKAFKAPFKYGAAAMAGIHALPKKNPSSKPVLYQQVKIEDLPLIHHWPMDGGAFITLPQVYSEDPDAPGIMKANLGMYRVQLNGNDYKLNEEIGLHYQIHRGIGVHQSKANRKGEPLKVSIFVGGPPAHTLAAVMPLPEDMSEMTFAGLLGGRRFRYAYEDGYCISTDADFVITGTIAAQDTKPEGPFGDHLGYYSLKHDFPVMQVQKVYARKNAIWPFTVVGRPPQEDTTFGALIHELTGEAITQELPGVKEVHAVDAAGVHPLLLAIGSERYTPYTSVKEPSELLTQANKILGTGQLSLAKYLFIGADERGHLHAHDIPAFFDFMLRRFRSERDIHFQTNTTIDTLDYSGTGLNKGSKAIIAACGDEVRDLCRELPSVLREAQAINSAHLILPGIAAITTKPFTDYNSAAKEMEELNQQLLPKAQQLATLPMLIISDDSAFTAQTLNNFLWVAFTRSNPANDIYGVDSFTQYKHWGCRGPLIIDARIKPHHAPALERDPKIELRVDRLFSKGGSLAGIR